MPRRGDSPRGNRSGRSRGPKIAGLILAAGPSSRMGRPKQLLVYEGMSLLRRTARAAVESKLDPIVVVLGAQAELLAAELADLSLQTVVNADWRDGMGSSIRAGARAINAADFKAVAILLADQPFVTPAVICRLVEAFHASAARIVASAYGGALGVPAIFDRTYLPRLMELPGDRGARGLLASAASAVHSVPFPQGVDDVDTPQDYERLLESNG